MSDMTLDSYLSNPNYSGLSEKEKLVLVCNRLIDKIMHGKYVGRNMDHERALLDEAHERIRKLETQDATGNPA